MLSDPKEIKKLHESLEVMGEHKVREFIAHRRFPEDELPIVKPWLEEKDRIRQVSLQHDANRIARKANHIAFAALAFSFLAVIVSVVALKYQSRGRS
jgi:hypothetical protein